MMSLRRKLARTCHTLHPPHPTLHPFFIFSYPSLSLSLTREPGLFLHMGAVHGTRACTHTHMHSNADMFSPAHQ